MHPPNILPTKFCLRNLNGTLISLVGKLSFDQITNAISYPFADHLLQQ